jgi:hypothetical protein
MSELEFNFWMGVIAALPLIGFLIGFCLTWLVLAIFD